jgi:hypothetical protein
MPALPTMGGATEIQRPVLVSCFAVYRAEENGPVDSADGITSICVALFTDADEALALARIHLFEGYSVSIEIGAMTRAEWDAIEEVPDDFAFVRPEAAIDAGA